MSDTAVLEPSLVRRLMSLVDTDVLSDTCGSPDPAHWRQGRLRGPDPWTAGVLYALSRMGSAPDLVESGLVHMTAVQDRNGAFMSERSEVEPTPWTVLFLQLILSEGKLSRSVSSAVSLSVKKAFSRIWDSAVLWPLPARLASLAAFAAAGDTRGVERMLRLVREVWEDGPEVLPWMYQALWLLAVTAAGVPLPSWLEERHEALLIASDVLTDCVQFPIVPVPQWDTPFVPFVLSMKGASDMTGHLPVALPDDALPPMAGSLVLPVANHRHGAAAFDDNILKSLGIYLSEEGAYRIVVFPSLGAFAVINREGGHLVTWDQGVTMNTDAGRRLSNAVLHEPPEVETGPDSITVRVRISAPVLMDIPVPVSVRKLISSGFDTVSRHVPHLRSTGRHILSMLERSRKMPVLERKIVFGTDGIGAVDTITLSDGHEITGALLGSADYDRRFLGWFIPPDPSYCRTMTRAELALMKERGHFHLRRRFS